MSSNFIHYDRHDLSVSRDDNILNDPRWIPIFQNDSFMNPRLGFFFFEFRVDYMLVKHGSDSPENLNSDLLNSNLNLVTVDFEQLEDEFVFLNSRKVNRELCLLGIPPEHASGILSHVSSFCRTQLDDPRNAGSKIIPAVASFIVYTVQREDEDVNAARTRAQHFFDLNVMELLFLEDSRSMSPEHSLFVDMTSREDSPSMDFMDFLELMFAHHYPLSILNPCTATSSSSFVDVMDRVPVDHRGASVCPICLHEPSMGETISSLPCSHVFHSDCIINWLKMNNLCPMCRKKVA